MEENASETKPEATFGLAAKFALRLLALTILFSIIPLLFVNLPLNMFLTNFGNLYIPAMLVANCLAVFLSCALAIKLILAWGVGGFQFTLTKEAKV
ncbi:hypothetical protein [Pseudomonas benzenivorans]|uniref:Uncharacterized protein n=1 Tax=Pseudomonas benzenivorans TaxID=556533 RepID=A0ABY5H135_9PSED|nr:hypothetical protein [Pseudomonas benzenivorans]UTW05968.1 hypothetical protein KDW96_12275 [Pseudomonas benzenivorans]